jgi:hypothetical protein
MDLLSALRDFTSFELPARHPAGERRPSPVPPAVDWEPFADLAVRHGVAPLVAYNLDHRYGGRGAPEEVRDTLLGYFHGTLTDNVYKLVTLKRLLSEAPQIPVLLLEGAGHAEALYPHIAFRPIPDIHLLARRSDFMALAAASQPGGFALTGEEDGAVVLTDNRLRLLLHDTVRGLKPRALGLGRAAADSAEAEIFSRAIPARAYSPGARRPAIEDALLAHVAVLGRQAFASPLIEFVDLRELALGCPAQGGTYQRAPDPAIVRRLAEALDLSRALYCALRLTAYFFPVAESAADALAPELSLAARALLDRGVVEPAQDLERTQVHRAAEQIRKLLVGS